MRRAALRGTPAMRIRGPEFQRYSAAIAVRSACQDARDALGGYVAADHPDHPNNSAPERRNAILRADAALQRATAEVDTARAAHVGKF
jgi:hypothetical protein